MTGSKFSREAFVADLQAKAAEAGKEAAAKEVQLRQVRAWLPGRLPGRRLVRGKECAARSGSCSQHRAASHACPPLAHRHCTPARRTRR